MASNHVTVTAPEHLQSLLSADLSRVSCLYFRADWAEPCVQMDQVVKELAKRWEQVLFLSIEAEALPDISESFEVDAVPYFILLRGHTLLTRLSGAQPSVLSSVLTSHCSPSATAPLSRTSQTPASASTVYNPEQEDEEDGEEEEEESEKDLEERCRQIMGKSKVVLFMKGDRNTPRCGFSQKIIGILNAQLTPSGDPVEYSTFDILSDEGVRQKLKSLNDWPTFPQLIINNEFVGGLDVVQEMVDSGEFAEMLDGAEA